jgi:hypothetical protein
MVLSMCKAADEAGLKPGMKMDSFPKRARIPCGYAPENLGGTENKK